MPTLKIGDRIYAESYSKIISVYTVNRVTKTLAFCENEAKFKIEYSDSGYCYKSGNTDKWNSFSYWIENENMKEKWYRQNAISKIRSFKYEDLETNKIQAIISLIK